MAAELGPVNLIPPGLLGVLNLKQMGSNPSTLVQSYQPVIDTLRWLLNGNREGLTDTANLGAGAGGRLVQFTNITVPQNEWWYVHNASFTATVAAGDSLIAPAVFYAPSTGTLLPRAVVASALFTFDDAAGQSAFFGAEDFFVPPLSQWTFGGGGTNAAAIALAAHISFTRLRI